MEESQRMKGDEKKKGRRAAVCRMQREIKGASPSIDRIKIGFHLQLSYCCCLFVCLNKSCDLAERTLCLLSIQGTRGKREQRTEAETLWRARRIRRKRITLQQCLPWFPFVLLTVQLKPPSP